MTVRRRRLWRSVAAILAIGFAIARPSGASRAQPSDPATLVVLVRHAERADASDDSPLSALGETRARALASALADAGVTHVITSSRRRTIQTAQAVLDARRLTPEIVGVDSGTAAQVAAVAAAVRRQRGGVVLVVGHSNTVPTIIGALGGPSLRDLCDAEFATMFVMELGGADRPRLLRTRYGEPDPAGADACSRTTGPATQGGRVTQR